MDLMNEWSEKNLVKLKKTHAELLEKKYREGDKEHGGDLRDMNFDTAMEEAIMENIDQFVYLMRIKETVNELRRGTKGTE